MQRTIHWLRLRTQTLAVLWRGKQTQFFPRSERGLFGRQEMLWIFIAAFPINHPQSPAKVKTFFSSSVSAPKKKKEEVQRPHFLLHLQTLLWCMRWEYMMETIEKFLNGKSAQVNYRKETLLPRRGLHTQTPSTNFSSLMILCAKLVWFFFSHPK